MNALTILARKIDVRLTRPKEFVRQRMAENASILNRAGADAARLEMASEALCRCVELLYLREGSRLCNVDPLTFRVLIPSPMGDHGSRYYGLRYKEGRALRAVLWGRQQNFKSGQRPPLFVYDEEMRSWLLNYGDYSTVEAAGWWLQRSAITLDEWQTALHGAL